LLAICWEEERETGVFGWRKKKEAKKAMADEEITVQMGVIYSPK